MPSINPDRGQPLRDAAAQRAEQVRAARQDAPNATAAHYYAYRPAEPYLSATEAEENSGSASSTSSNFSGSASGCTNSAKNCSGSAQSCSGSAQSCSGPAQGCSGTNARAAQCCTSPEQVFGIAASLAVFFWSRLTMQEVQTLINLLTLLVANLSTLVIQKQLCEGLTVTPPE